MEQAEGRVGGKISLTRGAWEMWCKVRLARKCNPLRRWPFHTTRPLAASSFGRLGTFVGLLLGYSNCRSPLLLKLRVQKRTTLDVQRRYYQSHSFGCSRRVPSLGHCFSAKYSIRYILLFVCPRVGATCYRRTKGLLVTLNCIFRHDTRYTTS